MVEVVISIAEKVAKVLVVSIGKQICYPFKYKTNMEELKKQVQKLTNQRETVQHSIDEARRQGEEIEKFVEDWMNRVDEFAETVVKPITNEQDKAGKLCSFGFCSNLKTRYFLSKKALKTAKDGISLLGEATFQKVSYRPAIRRTKSVYTRGYEDFGSRMPVFEEIMKALADEDVNLIGVYGMGGVGKTTLAKRVAAQAIDDKLFDVVVMAEVTQTIDIKSLQGQIADELDLKFNKESLSGRATQLRERLKNETSVLLIVDNIWEKLDLDAVGIPAWNEEKSGVTQEVGQRARNDNRREWKLLLTSRYLHVLQNDMNTQKNFFVKTLSDVEARKLFWKIVNHSKEDADFNLISIEIVRKCAGLPIAITTIANALKNKDLSDWKDALQWLRKSNPKPIEGMEKGVYSTIELSYNMLGSEEQSLFLLCGLDDPRFGSLTNDLFKYSWGLNLFNSVDTLEDARNRIHTLINNLKASCLLLDGHAKGSVKMHDAVHAVAVAIASSNDKLMFNIQNVSSVKEMLEEKLPKDSVAVCHYYGDVKELPEMLEFPHLKFFHLCPGGRFSLQIPNAFFDNTKELKVLDLTRFDLSSLPSSLCRLTNLQTLCLDGCLIGDIAIIGELKKLEILSFAESEIEQLSGEIGQLTRLRLLDLSNCSKLKVITPNVLSSLTRLEELYMGNSFVQWDVDGQRNASLVELKKLSNLTTLEIQVLEAQIMPLDLFFKKLERYKIFIGDVWEWSNNNETSRILKLKLNDSFFLSDGIKFLLNRVEDLHLDEPKGNKNVLQELNGEGFQQLKHLHIQNAPQIQYISSSVGWGLCNVFPHRLESLVLQNLINLEKIYDGQLAVESFSQLKVIKIGKCDKLKHLTLPMAGNLLQLREIEVTYCIMLEEIVFVGGRQAYKDMEQNSRIEFTCLRTVTLQCLPRLTRFGFVAPTSNIGFQEILAEDNPDNFSSLFSENALLPRLENLKLSSFCIEFRWLDQLPAVSSYCQTLATLTVEECSGLQFLFSYSMVKSLARLQILEVCNCKAMEAIFNTEEFAREEIEMIFPSLNFLKLEGLPKLTRFGSANIVEFPTLSYLEITECPELKTFISDSTCESMIVSMEHEETNSCNDIYPLLDKKVGFPNLEKVVISGMDNLKSIWHNQFIEDSFCNLKSVEVNDCQMLITIFPSFVCGRLLKLEYLTVKSCGLVEEIFDLQGLNFEEKRSTQTIQLKALYVDRLSNLKHIWNEDPKGKLSYEKLQKVTVFLCPNLKNLFPASIGRSLLNLESLEVSDCGVEEIIANEGMKVAASRFVFPQLTSLQLHNLPELTTFYPGHTVEGPCLKTLGLHHSDKVKSPFFVLRELEGRNQGFPNLKELQLSGNAIKMAWQGQIRELNSLELMDDESTVLPLDFIQRFSGLRKLLLNSGSYEEIFSHGEEKEHPEIQHLVLTELHNLQQIWKQRSKIDLNFRNLQILQVRSCVSLIILMPSSTSFQNLTILEVWGCEQLKNLLASSTVKSLMQLEKLEVFDCKMLTEIVANDEGGIIEEITFRKLKSLSLLYLESLASFCPMKNNLNFPILESLVVNECPEMKIFSGGVTSTPRFCELELNWKGVKQSREADINTTIQQNMKNRVLNLDE